MVNPKHNQVISPCIISTHSTNLVKWQKEIIEYGKAELSK